MAGILDDLAEVHHRDPVGDVADHAEVVRDEQIRQAELVLKLLEQVDDLRLHGHVERRHRLVGDDQLRVQRQRPGDADALALPAGELVRDSGCSARGCRPTRSSNSCTRRFSSAPLASPCSSIGSPTIWPTRLRGFSDANGSWKIICIWRRSGRSSRRDRPTSSSPRNRTDPDVGVRQLEDRPAQRRLAAAGFADQTECFAFAQGQADAVDRAHPGDLALDHHPRLDREVLDEVGDLQQRIALAHGITCARRRFLLLRIEPAAVEVVAACAGFQCGRLVALVEGVRAAGSEPAARWRRQQRRGLAGDLRQARGARLIEPHERPEQSPGVGVLRVVEDLVERRILDDLAGVHDHDAVGDLGDHPEVVGDQDDGQVAVAVELIDAAAGSAPAP